MNKILLFCLTAVIFCGGYTAAGSLKSKQIIFPPDEISRLEANFDIGAGEINLKPGDTTKAIIRADVDYDPEYIQVYSDYEKRGKAGYLDVGSELHRHTKMDTEDNRWNIILSKQYQTELKMDVGACDADLDLGGIPLTFLKLSIGAAKGILVFSSPNPAICDISIDAGASSFKVEKLGNANFENLTLDGGVGEFILDFAGEYKTKARARISIGLGKATIYIPSGLPIRIEAKDNFLSSVKFRNAERFDIEEGYCESKDFHDSSTRLDLKIDVSLGKVEIVWVD
jgi:N-terminal domain of toast_rack, DUF2154/Cell wall-active antibiotics response LiaF, C-terminal